MFGLGGNAMDAAAAASFAAGVVEPAMSGVGGRGYLVLLPSGGGEPVAIDGHERAPLGASRGMFRLLEAEQRIVSGWGPHVEVAANANSEGHLAVAVPAVLRALAVAHERHGRLPWRTVVDPAIGFAANGFEIDRTLAAHLAAQREKLARYPASAEVFLDQGRPRTAGERLVQRDLANSLRLIAECGAEELFTGSLAKAIAREMKRGGGVLSRVDLERIEPRIWPATMTGIYRGYRLCGLPDAAGTVTLLEIMNMLEGVDVGSVDATDPHYLHLLLEIFRAAFRDRFRYVADPGFARVPFNALTTKRFAAERLRTIDRDRRHEQPADIDPWALDAPASRHTTHLCAVDDERMVVSMTQSVIDPFGSGVVVEGTGILLNSAMHNFDPRPGRLRSIEPWKRSAHFGTPLLLLGPDGGAFLALGGAGGTKVVTGLAQVLAHVVDRGWCLQDAIEAPRVHCETAVSEIDARISRTAGDELRRRGHTVDNARSHPGAAAFARINGIEIGRDGTLSSGVDVFEHAGAAAGEPGPQDP